MAGMTQSEFVDESVAEWGRLLPDQNMLGLDVAQRLVWSGRLAHRIMDRSAIAAGLGRRGDFEVLALLRRNEPDLLTPVEVAKKLLSSQSGMTGKLDHSKSRASFSGFPTPRTGERSGYVSRTAAAD